MGLPASDFADQQSLLGTRQSLRQLRIRPSVRPIFRARRLAPGSNISSSQDGGQHDGRDQEEDAGDEAGEGERVRQGRPARAETQRTEDRLRAGLSLTDPVTIELYGAARQTIVMSIQLSLTQ